MNFAQILPLLSLTLLLACGKAPEIADGEWGDGVAQPLLTDSSQRHFASLPLTGSVDTSKRLWSGDYWANNKGSINYRWYTGEHGFYLDSPTLSQAQNMSHQELSALSATEKFDLLLGRYDYPLKAEVSRVANPNAQYWEGICHGWAPAAINFDEPTPKVITNPQGISIPFASTDIKALISYYYAHIYKPFNTFQIGRRCPKPDGWFNREEDCHEDLNAGTFHTVLANNIGLKRRSFIADIKRFEEVWNHPYSSYKTFIEKRDRSPGRRRTSGTAEVVTVSTEVQWLNESENNTWGPVIGTSDQQFKNSTYRYELDLNADGIIIGGKWKSKERPDFLWTSDKPVKFMGNLSGLENLIR